MERFWNKVNKQAENGCWEWTASVNNKGYGWFRLDGKNRGAHRVSWMLQHGAVPGGLFVLHRCDNPSCVNPDHLWLGTNADNMRDKVEKGRAPALPGESNGQAKLTEADVIAIRADHRSLRAIAAEYGVSHALIGYIKRGDHWSHI